MGPMNLIELFLDHLRAKRVSAHTIKAYRLDLLDYLKHLSEEFAFQIKSDENQRTETHLFDGLIQATSVDLNNYRAYLGQSLPATITRKFATLKKFLNWLHKEGRRTKSLPTFPILPKKQPLAPKWLSKNEIHELLRKAERSSQSCSNRNYVIVTLLLNTGIRVGELVNLKWEDIEFKRYDGSLKIQSGKGQKERIVPLNAKIRSILLIYKEQVSKIMPGKEYLFYGKRGKINENAVLKMFYTLSKTLNFEVTPHDLRHTFCKLLLDKNVSLDKIATLAGHSSLNITQRYLTPSFQDLSDSVDKLIEL